MRFTSKTGDDRIPSIDPEQGPRWPAARTLLAQLSRAPAYLLLSSLPSLAAPAESPRPTADAADAAVRRYELFVLGDYGRLHEALGENPCAMNREMFVRSLCRVDAAMRWRAEPDDAGLCGAVLHYKRDELIDLLSRIDAEWVTPTDARPDGAYRVNVETIQAVIASSSDGHDRDRWQALSDRLQRVAAPIGSGAWYPVCDMAWAGFDTIRHAELAAGLQMSLNCFVREVDDGTSQVRLHGRVTNGSRHSITELVYVAVLKNMIGQTLDRFTARIRFAAPGLAPASERPIFAVGEVASGASRCITEQLVPFSDDITAALYGAPSD